VLLSHKKQVLTSALSQLNTQISIRLRQRKEDFMQGSKSIKGQLTDKHRELCRFGQKRHEAKKVYGGVNKVPTIHSFETYNTYKKQIKAFADFLMKPEINVRKIEDIKPVHVKMYLEYCQARGDSTYSLNTYAAAITKVTGITRDKIGFQFPTRKRENITRSRGVSKSELKINISNYSDVIALCKACGLRRREAQSLLWKDIIVTEKDITIHVRNAKGGRPRTVKANKTYEPQLRKVIQQKGAHKPDEHFIDYKIPKNIDVHGLRAEAAKTLYMELERERGPKKFSRKEEYHTRDGTGRVFDKEILLKVSNFLGHNRIDVAVKHYL